MSFTFYARKLCAQEIDDFNFIGFADDEQNYIKYVNISWNEEYDEQDVEMDMGKLHIEVKDQSRSMYGGVTEIQFSDGEFKFLLSEEAQTELKIDGDISIRCDINNPEFESTLSELKRMASFEKIPIQIS